ncbi:MAG: 6-phosphogluconolactonase [Elusimicrobiota bacterium]
MNDADAAVHVADDEEALAEETARALLEAAEQAAARSGRFTMTLSGGRTPEALYARLAREPYRGRMPWGKVHLFMGDERFVPPDHPESNYRMVRSALLEKIPIPAVNIHPMPTQCAGPAECAADYERSLKTFFGAAGFPVFDVALMGLGEDGHTASLFPGTPALEEKTRWAVEVFPPLPSRPPCARVTLTFPVFNSARRIIFLAAGAGKARILKEIRQGPPDRYPAQKVQPVAGRLEWRVDRAAWSESRP